jgi:two-component system sensor histidine kinase YesM
MMILGAVALTTTLCAMLAARLPYAPYDAQIYVRSVQMITLLIDRLQSETAHVTDASFAILADNVIQDNLSELKRAAIGSSRWLEAKRAIQERVDILVYLNEYIMTLQILSSGGETFTRAPRASPAQLGDLLMYRELASTRGGREVWLADANTENSLVCARDVREVRDLSLASIGTVVMKVDLARIIARCGASLASMGEPLSVAVFSGGQRLYATDDLRGESFEISDGYSRENISGRDMLRVAYTSPATGWQFVTAVPYEGINAAILGAARVSIGISIVAAALALALGYLLIASLLKRFDMLLKRFRNFNAGKFDETPPDAYENRRDEIGALHRQFSEIAKAYNRMIEDNYVKRQLLLEAQYRQLRAQVRPHFLYNTLESIYCLAKTAGDERIAEMADALGKMLRASLKDKRDVITIAEDAQIAREYLRIQLLRYGDRLSSQFDLPDNLLGVMIPNMTIQPLVENAVLHAAEEMLECCCIKICASRLGDGVGLSIENNGPPLDENILSKLESGEAKASGLGIGLGNIHQRIQIAFGKEYGLKIESADGTTRVSAIVPFSSGEKIHER